MSKKRKIKGLVWAGRLQGRPAGLPVGRPRGAKAAGVRYERAFARALPKIEHGPWFSYRDSNGAGYCQPDMLLVLDSCAIVFEIKYTWVSGAFEELYGLYIPVLSHALARPVIGVHVCKRLLPEATKTKICSGLVEAIMEARSGKNVTLHWLEGTPISLKVPAELAEERKELLHA